MVVVSSCCEASGNSFNERNPFKVFNNYVLKMWVESQSLHLTRHGCDSIKNFPKLKLLTLKKLTLRCWEEGMDDVKSLWSTWTGLHMCCNGYLYKRMQRCEPELNVKIIRSSDCKLKLICMKVESLVIVEQHATVNMFLSLVHTARQARKTSGG